LATYIDALGRAVDIASPPERIVSLVPSITEALFAFGASDRVVGVTRFCIEPAAAVADVPKVGGTKDVDCSRVLGLNPDLVIANVEENTQADIDRLLDAGLTVLVTYPRTVAEAIGELRLIAEITHTATTAEPYLADAQNELRTATQLTAHYSPLATSVFCPIWRKPWMTIGPETYIHDMLRICGGLNVYGDSEDRYPTVTLGEVHRRAPTIVLLPDEPYPFKPKHAKEVIAGLGDVRIHFVDGKDLCWYGPRIGPAIRSISRLLTEGQDSS